jgi:hypothetical protein
MSETIGPEPPEEQQEIEETELSPEEIGQVLKKILFEAVDSISKIDQKILLEELASTGIEVPAKIEGEPPTEAPLDIPKVRYDLSKGLKPFIERLCNQYVEELSSGRDWGEILGDILTLSDRMGQDPDTLLTRLAEFNLA